MTLIILGTAFWLTAWVFSVWIVRRHQKKRLVSFIVPVIFGLSIIVIWECVVRGLKVPSVLLPSPSAISYTFMQSLDILWIDFVQTVLKGALIGYIIGCGSAIVTSLLIERWTFLKRGLLPVGNFVAALPIVGLAPILVMWFGFDWQSKSAVVVAMVFFPVLVNTMEGLQATDKMQRDLMHTYASSYWGVMLKLKIPGALPFIFNGLKIASTLALIGAIVAEFFGSPVKGMGFRISTSVGQLNLELVWSEILVAAMAGTVFYGVIVLMERKVTFWHPSQQGSS